MPLSLIALLFKFTSFVVLNSIFTLLYVPLSFFSKENVNLGVEEMKG